jgi:GH24 family phage-related lysozyme (muramidase)
MAILTIRREYLVLGGLVLLFALGASFRDRLLDRLAAFIPSVEGFSAKSYWDVSRYSWGYGTAAPGPDAYITREQAFNDMVAYLLRDYATLSNKITRNLNVNQWAAYLSFSYNEGIGNALNLVSNINSGNDQALGIQWNKYIYAGGVIDNRLIERRKKEFNLWNS